MKPSSFDYVTPDSIEAAVAALVRFEGDARILAGGQSLMPLINMRMMRPAGIIDVNRIDGLGAIRLDGGAVRIGALARYASLEQSAIVTKHLPLVATAVRRVADRQVRNRGTLGGSLCHADPAAQMPLCAVTLGATLTIAGPDGRRTQPAGEFFHGPYSTAADALEMLVEIAYPDAVGTRATLAQHIKRHGDFPVVSVAASGRRNPDGSWSDWRIGACGLADRPVLAAAVMQRLEGQTLDEALIADAAPLVLDGSDPPEDVRASAEYRRHLAPLYVERALTTLLREAA